MTYKHTEIENMYYDKLWHITNTLHVKSTVTVVLMKEQLRLMC